MVSLDLSPGTYTLVFTAEGVPQGYDTLIDRVILGFICGDADGSGSVTVSDVIYLVNYIFASGPSPLDPSAGDFNCSGSTNISDAVYLINYIFSGGAAPCAAC